MRKLLVHMMLTLDGVMQAPGGPEEDEEGGFRFGGWTAPLADEGLDAAEWDALKDPFDLLLDRRTYEIWAGYWPTAPDEAPPTKPFNEATKFVVSRSGASLDWGPAQLIDDAAEGVAELKETEGADLHVWGSGKLLQTLMSEGLVDEYRLMTFPVTIGTGKRLFADGTIPATFRLVESSISSNGIVIARYRPAGELETGSFA